MLIIMELVVFGVGEIDLGIGVMLGELLFQGDELVAFFGITGNGEAGDGKFEAEGSSMEVTRRASPPAIWPERGYDLSNRKYYILIS